LRVRDTETMEVPGTGSPGPHACGGTRLHQIDRRQAPEIMPLAVAREVALVRAPTHLARLAPFADETVDGPGVDELAALLRLAGGLSVALGDVNHLHAQALCEITPVRARGGIARVDSRVGGNVEQGLLDEMRDQAGIRSVRENRGRRL